MCAATDHPGRSRPRWATRVLTALVLLVPAGLPAAASAAAAPAAKAPAPAHRDR